MADKQYNQKKRNVHVIYVDVEVYMWISMHYIFAHMFPFFWLYCLSAIYYNSFCSQKKIIIHSYRGPTAVCNVG
jgi:hypothetical protein